MGRFPTVSSIGSQPPHTGPFLVQAGVATTQADSTGRHPRRLRSRARSSDSLDRPDTSPGVDRSPVALSRTTDIRTVSEPWQNHPTPPSKRYAPQIRERGRAAGSVSCRSQPGLTIQYHAASRTRATSMPKRPVVSSRVPVDAQLQRSGPAAIGASSDRVDEQPSVVASPSMRPLPGPVGRGTDQSCPTSAYTCLIHHFSPFPRPFSVGRCGGHTWRGTPRALR